MKTATNKVHWYSRAFVALHSTLLYSELYVSCDQRHADATLSKRENHNNATPEKNRKQNVPTQRLLDKKCSLWKRKRAFSTQQIEKVKEKFNEVEQAYSCFSFVCNMNEIPSSITKKEKKKCSSAWQQHENVIHLIMERATQSNKNPGIEKRFIWYFLL